MAPVVEITTALLVGFSCFIIIFVALGTGLGMLVVTWLLNSKQNSLLLSREGQYYKLVVEKPTEEEQQQTFTRSCQREIEKRKPVPNISGDVSLCVPSPSRRCPTGLPGDEQRCIPPPASEASTVPSFDNASEGNDSVCTPSTYVKSITVSPASFDARTPPPSALPHFLHSTPYHQPPLTKFNCSRAVCVRDPPYSYSELTGLLFEGHPRVPRCQLLKVLNSLDADTLLADKPPSWFTAQFLFHGIESQMEQASQKEELRLALERMEADSVPDVMPSEIQRRDMEMKSCMMRDFEADEVSAGAYPSESLERRALMNPSEFFSSIFDDPSLPLNSNNVSDGAADAGRNLCLIRGLPDSDITDQATSTSRRYPSVILCLRNSRDQRRLASAAGRLGFSHSSVDRLSVFSGAPQLNNGRFVSQPLPMGLSYLVVAPSLEMVNRTITSLRNESTQQKAEHRAADRRVMEERCRALESSLPEVCGSWDVTGVWAIDCESLKEFEKGLETEIGDLQFTLVQARGELFGSFDFDILKGHLHLDAKAGICAARSKTKLRWSGRDTREGLVMTGRNKGSVNFESPTRCSGTLKTPLGDFAFDAVKVGVIQTTSSVFQTLLTVAQDPALWAQNWGLTANPQAPSLVN